MSLDPQTIRPPVSFGNEQLILVDSHDVVTGYASKLKAHRGAGTLHRAFSVFLFDEHLRLLVHRRSNKKPLWPGFWTNSCCSHPRRGESIDSAVRRRIVEELGVEARSISFAYKFEYREGFGNAGTEHELCHVYLAQRQYTGEISAHEDEVMEWRWLSVEEVDDLVREAPEQMTPWFLLEWAALRNDHAGALSDFLTAVQDGL